MSTRSADIIQDALRSWSRELDNVPAEYFSSAVNDWSREMGGAGDYLSKGINDLTADFSKSLGASIAGFSKQLDIGISLFIDDWVNNRTKKERPQEKEIEKGLATSTDPNLQGVIQGLKFSDTKTGRVANIFPENVPSLAKLFNDLHNGGFSPISANPVLTRKKGAALGITSGSWDFEHPNGQSVSIGVTGQEDSIAFFVAARLEHDPENEIGTVKEAIAVAKDGFAQANKFFDGKIDRLDFSYFQGAEKHFLGINREGVEERLDPLDLVFEQGKEIARLPLEKLISTKVILQDFEKEGFFLSDATTPFVDKNGNVEGVFMMSRGDETLTAQMSGTIKAIHSEYTLGNITPAQESKNSAQVTTEAVKLLNGISVSAIRHLNTVAIQNIRDEKQVADAISAQSFGHIKRPFSLDKIDGLKAAFDPFEIQGFAYNQSKKAMISGTGEVSGCFEMSKNSQTITAEISGMVGDMNRSFTLKDSTPCTEPHQRKDLKDTARGILDSLGMAGSCVNRIQLQNLGTSQSGLTYPKLESFDVDTLQKGEIKLSTETLRDVPERPEYFVQVSELHDGCAVNRRTPDGQQVEWWLPAIRAETFKDLGARGGAFAISDAENAGYKKISLVGHVPFNDVDAGSIAEQQLKNIDEVASRAGITVHQDFAKEVEKPIEELVAHAWEQLKQKSNGLEIGAESFIAASAEQGKYVEYNRSEVTKQLIYGSYGKVGYAPSALEFPRGREFGASSYSDASTQLDSFWKLSEVEQKEVQKNSAQIDLSKVEKGEEVEQEYTQTNEEVAAQENPSEKIHSVPEIPRYTISVTDAIGVISRKTPDGRHVEWNFPRKSNDQSSDLTTRLEIRAVEDARAEGFNDISIGSAHSKEVPTESQTRDQEMEDISTRYGITVHQSAQEVKKPIEELTAAPWENFVKNLVSNQNALQVSEDTFLTSSNSQIVEYTRESFDAQFLAPRDYHHTKWEPKGRELEASTFKTAVCLNAEFRGLPYEEKAEIMKVASAKDASRETTD